MPVITEPEVKLLRQLYNNAIKEEQTQFMFKGKVLLVDYAKYLLEYLDDFFKRGKR